MALFFASGRVIDLILALTAAEAIILLLLRYRSGRGLAPGDLLFTLASGACLMIAVRLALVGAWWGWLALFLARRWR
jgi:hypothetical protein